MLLAPLRLIAQTSTNRITRLGLPSMGLGARVFKSARSMNEKITMNVFTSVKRANAVLHYILRVMACTSVPLELRDLASCSGRRVLDLTESTRHGRTPRGKRV